MLVLPHAVCQYTVIRSAVTVKFIYYSFINDGKQPDMKQRCGEQTGQSLIPKKLQHCVRHE